MSLTLYHAPYSRSFRVAVLLEEMGLEHELKIVPQAEFFAYAKTDEYRAVNPLGKFPVLIDGDLTLVESIAIMEYLLSRYGDGPTAGGLRPEPGTANHGRYLQWLEFGEAGMGPYMSMLVGHLMKLPEKHRLPIMVKWADAEVKNCYAFLSDGLGDKPYLCGEGFTAADISVAYTLLVLKLLGRLDGAPENVQAYFDRVRERPAWKTVSAKAR